MKKIFIPPVCLFTSLVFIVIFFFLLQNLNLIFFPYNLLGIIIIFCGLTIMGKTRELFKKHNTTLYFEKSACLIEEGLFKISRNPMYLGMFIILLGTAICFSNTISLLIPFIFLTIITIFFIPIEEKMLEETFGNKYIAYKKQTRMWI